MAGPKSKIESKTAFGAIFGFQKMRGGRALRSNSGCLETRVSILGKNRWKIGMKSAVAENGGMGALNYSSLMNRRYKI